MPTAVITGASEGLGRALAEDLARERWTVVIDGRRSVPLLEAEAELRAAGATVHAVVGDVGNGTHRDALVTAARATGRLDLLVNNASTLGPTPLPELAVYPPADLEQVYRVNVVAPLALTQLALPLLVASQGAVVNITSDAAVEPYETWGGYGSSKAALEQLSRILAAEQPDLRIYWFDPGDMRTRMHQDAFPGEDISDRPLPATVVPALRRLLASGAPSGRARAADLLAASAAEPVR